MKSLLINYINKIKINFIIITILFCIGIVIGVFLINSSNDIQKNEINNHIDNLLTNTKNSNEIDRVNLLMLSIKNNILLILIIWFLGCTVIGGPIIYLVILYKGFSVGYTISALVAVLGIKIGALVALASLLFQNIIYLPALFIIAESGIELYKGIYRRCVNLKAEVIRHTLIMFITAGISVFSSLIEVYCSTNIFLLLTNIIVTG